MTARVLVVGAGVMGHRHAAAVRAAGDRIAVVVDADAARAATLDADATPVTTLDEALRHSADLDAAIVATPSGAHLGQTLALVAAGLPVLVEKPHRVPGQDPAPLLAAVAAGADVMVGMSTRHWPGVVAVAEAVAAGELGDILSYVDRMGFRLDADALPSWYFDSATSGGGVLVTNGVHALDRAAAILATPLEQVSGRLTAVLPGHDVEHHAVVRFRAGRTEGLVELLWMPYAPAGTGLVVTGTRGTATVGMDGAWRIETDGETREGPAIDIDVEPFARQWAAFRRREPGFAVADLEPTLAVIEQLYREVAHV